MQSHFPIPLEKKTKKYGARNKTVGGRGELSFHFRPCSAARGWNNLAILFREKTPLFSNFLGLQLDMVYTVLTPGGALEARPSSFARAHSSASKFLGSFSLQNNKFREAGGQTHTRVARS